MKKQEGFALVESLIIVLILAVIGFGGYKVWHNEKNKSPAASTSSSRNTSSSTVSKQPSSQPATLSSYDPVDTPDILPTLNTDMKAQKLAYNYMIIGEWNVKSSTIDTTNKQLPYYLNYRWDATDNNNLQSIVVFSGADSSGNDKTCTDNGAVGPVVYMMRDTTADDLGYTDFQPISDLNVGGHVFHVYEQHCSNDTNTAVAHALENQLETLTVNKN